MALEVVGGAFLSSFLSVLFGRMASRQVLDFIRGQKITDGLLKKLQIKLLSVNTVLDDAEEKQIRNPTVRKWLDELKDVVYAAGDALDEIKTEAVRRKLEAESGSSSSTSWVQNLINATSFDKFDKTFAPKIEEILGRLELIVSQKDVLGLKEGVKGRSQATTRESTSLLEDSGVYGRDEDAESIIKLLLSDCATHDKISVIPITGMGGIGKTTLAQLVYNDVRVKQHFDLEAWVCVSEEFDILRVTETTYGSITSETCATKILDEMQVKLKEALTGKKFLIVYDDVWNENYIHWSDLRRPLESGAHGSKILVTTRNQGFASMMGTLPTHHLMQISDEDCWLLFGKHAFKNADVLRAHPKHEVIGRKIARKCKGLPLAAKSLGGLLRSELDLEVWENILMSDIWELSDKEVNILPALWLSYHYLPSHLKRCFAYCSIFPKDYEFTQSEVILLWMSEDLIQPTKKKMVEEVGKDCFNILISRSLFSPVTTGKHQSLFTMHDLVNDLAKFVSGEYCFRLEDDDSLNIGSKTRHFSYMKTYFDDFEKFMDLYRAKHLHTFLPLRYCSHNGGHFSNKVLYDLLPRLQFLRVLNLSGYDIVELPCSISNLKQLRQLELSNSSIEKLPDTICDLYNLQTLVLWNCTAIVQLPNKLGRLINMRHLDIKGTCLEKMPPDMRKLKNLQLLTYFVLDKDTGHSIAELKELQYLSGTLNISGLDNVVNVKNALEANIRDKKYVKKLVLTWSGSSEDSLKDREVCHELQPHTNLKQLKIISYGGTRFPKWVGDDCFSNLVSVTLMDCESCWFLPPLGQLPSLECLCIKGLGEVVLIGAEFYCNGNTCGMKPFRSLKELRFEQMWEWQDWSYVEGDEEGRIFPNLCRLTLKDCPKLTQLLAIDEFPKLEQLQLQNIGSLSGSPSRQIECPKFFSHSSLEIIDCPNFVSFSYGGHAPNLTKMVIHRCVKLRSLPEQMYTSLPSLQNISLKGCPKLESFPEGGLPPALESLEFECYAKLFANRANWGLQRLNSLRKLTISAKECGEVNSFPQEEMLPNTLTSLSIFNFQSLVTLKGKELRYLNSLEELVICGCPKLQCLPEKGLPSSLSKLEIWGSPLLEQRLQREKGEDWPKISHIPWINDFCWTEI